MNEERLVEIETQLAFQQQTVNELNDVIYKQQKEIDKLDTICETLAKRVKELSESAAGIDAPANDKPPHY